MDRADAQRVRVRREHLQLRLRRQQQARQFRALAQPLRDAGVRRLSRLPPERVQALSRARLNLPGRDERLYWPGIPEGTCRSWQEPRTRDAAFEAALRACFASPARLLVIFSPFESGLVLACADAIAQATRLLDACNGTLWIVALAGTPGLVEVSYSDNEVCWLR